MFSQDFIKRQISQATAVLLEALGLKTAGQYAAAHQSVEQVLAQIFTMHKELSDRLDDDSLLDILVIDEELDVERLAVVAELYFVDGEILAEMNQPTQAALANQRALRFYLELALIDFEHLNDEIAGKITNLQARLKGYALPQETQFALEDYAAAQQGE